MIKDTIDIATKANLRAWCLKDAAKWTLKGNNNRIDECNTIGKLYTNWLGEWKQNLDEYQRKMTN